MKPDILSAEAMVHVGIAQARQWFTELKTHPERYSFETHTGLAFTQGDFGQVGARFQTRERFHGLGLALRFELTEIGDTHFRFRLIRPALPIWGAFVIEEVADDVTNLRLEIGGTTCLGASFLRLPPVRSAIQRQIRGEIEHIKASMEALLN